MAVTFRIKIDAPPERIFDYLSDLPRHGEWANPKASLRVDPVSGGTLAPGATYRSQAKFVGKAVSADLTVTAVERPSRFAFSLVQHQEGKKDVRFEQTFTLTPQDGGTVVEKQVGGGGNPIVGLVAYPAIRADAMTSLRNLKAKVEGGQV